MTEQSASVVNEPKSPFPDQLSCSAGHHTLDILHVVRNLKPGADRRRTCYRLHPTGAACAIGPGRAVTWQSGGPRTFAEEIVRAIRRMPREERDTESDLLRELEAILPPPDGRCLNNARADRGSAQCLPHIPSLAGSAATRSRACWKLMIRMCTILSSASETGYVKVSSRLSSNWSNVSANPPRP